MTETLSKFGYFRALHVPGQPLVLFNIWDAGGARAVAAGGALALATGSWSVATSLGFTDGEQTPLALAIENLRRIVAATDLPVTVDLESRYGEVGETVRLASQAGAVSCNLEDSVPADGTLRTVNDQAKRLGQARQAAGDLFFLNARTNVFFQAPPEPHSEAMLDETLGQARAYAEVGADGLFAPGLTDLKLIARLVKASQMLQTPIYDLYARTAPRLGDWAAPWGNMGDLLRQDFDWSADISALSAPTLIVIGDADSTQPVHAAEFFALLGSGLHDGGWDGSGKTAHSLAILPDTTHYDIVQSPLLLRAVTPFLSGGVELEANL